MTSFTTMGPELQLNRSAEAGTRSTLPAVAEIGTGVAGFRVEGVEISAAHVDQAPVGAVSPVVHPP